MNPTSALSNTKPNSCKPGAVGVRCVNFKTLWAAHPMNWAVPEALPYRELAKIYNNQCAMNLSIAFYGGGLTVDTFTPKSRTELRLVPALNQKIRAVLSAQELANWLIKIWGKPEYLQPGLAKPLVTGRKGVIFFIDFWSTRHDGKMDGDHIDLWDGQRFSGASAFEFNVEGRLSPYFTKSKEVWFWELQ